jgi:hypothetical protein
VLWWFFAVVRSGNPTMIDRYETARSAEVPADEHAVASSRAAPRRRTGTRCPPSRSTMWCRPGGRKKVARKWRRNGLKRLNPGPELVWARQPRTYKIWYIGAALTNRENEPAATLSAPRFRPPMAAGLEVGREIFLAAKR